MTNSIEFNGTLFFDGATIVATFDGATLHYLPSKLNLPCANVETATGIVSVLDAQRLARDAALSATARKATETRKANIAARAAPVAPVAAIVPAPDAETVERVTKKRA